MERGITNADPGDDADVPDVADDRPPGTLIADKYRVVRPIGSGSMGTVYLCQHEGLERLVALKVLHREIEQNPGFVERFKREAKAASRLEHPNSVRVLDFGQDQAGALFIVMEYIEGRDLLRVLDEDGPFSAERAIDVMSQILDALSLAHSLGIVHRDLKPENVVVRSVLVDGLERELVTVCDFGIAQLAPIRLSGISASDVVSISDIGLVVGTPAYMSPEQARAEAQDARSDIYAAGVVLFQLLTLQLPFDAETPLAVAVKHCTEPPPRPSQFGAVSPALEEICLRALSKTPAARYQSAREMRAALQNVLLVPPRPAPRLQAHMSWRPARPAWAVSAGLHTPSGPASLAPVERITHPDAISRAERLRVPRPVWGFGLVLAGTAGLAFLLHSAESAINTGGRPARASSAQPAAATSRMAPSSNELAPALEPRPVSVATPALASSPIVLTAQPSEAPLAVLVAAPSSKRPLERSQPNPHATAKEPGPEAATPAPAPAASDLQPKAAEPVAPSPGPQADQAAHVPTLAANAASMPRAAPAPPVRAPLPSPNTATVTIGPIAARAAVSKASVRGALNLDALTSCYRDALRSGAAPATALSAQLDLTTNLAGGIASATFKGTGFSDSARQCIEQVARRGRVREVDTGQAQASITLFFQPR